MINTNISSERIHLTSITYNKRNKVFFTKKIWQSAHNIHKLSINNKVFKKSLSVYNMIDINIKI